MEGSVSEEMWVRSGYEVEGSEEESERESEEAEEKMRRMRGSGLADVPAYRDDYQLQSCWSEGGNQGVPASS